MSDWPEVGTKSEKPFTAITDGDRKATEQTITVGFDGVQYLIPTIVIDDEGFLIKVSDDDAIRLFQEGKNQAVGKFNTVEEATEFAKKRSASGGRFQKPITPIENIFEKK